MNTTAATSTTAAMTASSIVRRLGVGRTWGSIGRIVAFTVAWVLVIGWIVDPAAPSATDREREPDVPASPVRYLGPISPGDYGGFVAPTPGDDDDVFTVAFVGGSELKLREVSVVGEVANRITAVGAMAARFDGYTVVAPRPIDALRGMESAIANGSDAIVVSINAVWLTDEWSMREWENLDVANFGTLWRDPGSWPWALALESPGDAAWRVGRAVSPVVEAQQRLSTSAAGWVERLDMLEQPEPDAGGDAPPAGDANAVQLGGDPTTFWLVDAHGPDVMGDTTERVARMVEGFDAEAPASRHLVDRMIDTAEAADVPVFFYVAPFAPESASNPRFVAAEAKVTAYWTEIATTVTSPLVAIEPRSLTPEFADRAAYLDVVHMADAGPFADVLVGRLCEHWRTIDQTLECAP
jgi:hypothetical protein